MEQISATMPATTDPTASRQMFELERALAQLPLEQRQVILLVGLEGMSTRMQPEFSAFRSARSARAYLAAATFFVSFWIWRDALPWRLWRRLPDVRHGGAGLVTYFTTGRHEPSGYLH